MFDYLAMIFAGVLITCMISLLYAFRKEIKVVIQRIMYLLGLMPYWIAFKRKFFGYDQAELPEYKVNYEIYNP